MRSANSGTRSITFKKLPSMSALVASNSAACLSFMIERTSIAVCWAFSACCDTGVILLSIFIAGGKPAVMNRSEPFFAISARSRS